MTILDYFIERMEEMGLTNKDVAARCGCDKSYISALRSGKRNIGDNIFQRLCYALELDEADTRARFGDQIAPRGYNHNGSAKKNTQTEPPKKRKPMTARMTKREETDPAELVINMMHMFVCELNDNGKRVTMSIMKMLREIDAFKRINDEENEHEPDNEIQDR